MENTSRLRSVYKPHSVLRTPLRAVRMCDHLSGRCVTAPLVAAYPGLTLPPRERIRMKTSRLPPSADGFVPAWPCSRRGLPVHSHYCKCRWSLTPPFHPHPCPSPKGRGERQFVSVALFRQVRSSTEASPPRVLSDAVLYGVRTFLDPVNAGPRSPNRPEAWSSYTQGKGASTTRASSLRGCFLSTRIGRITRSNTDF